jgi:hypothetical protein
MLDAIEERDVAIVDIPGAFMQADIDEEVHVMFWEKRPERYWRSTLTCMRRILLMNGAR